MRIRSMIASTVLSLQLLSCSHQSDRGEEGPSLAMGSLPATQSNGVLSATLESVRRSPTTLWVRVRLENISSHDLELRNLGDTLTGFCCIIDGQRIAAPVQRGPLATAASTLSVVPAATPIDLDLSWHFPAGLLHGQYPFTINIGNIFQGGSKLKDLFLTMGQVDDAEPRSSDRNDASAPPATAPAAVRGESTPPATTSATAANVSM
jgi:hypothetical protein